MDSSTTTPIIPPADIGPTGTPFAGFWIRAGATFIDGLILFIPNFIISATFVAQSATGQIHTSFFGSVLLLAMYVAYYMGFNGGKWQATPGKRVMGIHLIRADGLPITYARALGRYFALVLSWILLAVGLIMVAFTREKTALHDLICETRVVYGKR